MKIKGWRYYDHAAIPTTPPHVGADVAPVQDKSIWDMDGKPLFARWTSDWDCGRETQWWYVIKDEPFDIEALKSKRRYEINKGNRYFRVEEIVPADHCEEIYRVASAAYATYPDSYRPNTDHDSFIKEVKGWRFYKTYGAFLRETGELCAYACLLRDGDYVDFRVLKAAPDKERLGVNAAVVSSILEDHAGFLGGGGYICDGSRSIQHETAFQDYLEKYFGFRKAYCVLHIEYKPSVKRLVSAAYRFRGAFGRSKGSGVMRKAEALLRMEEIRRSFELE